VTQLFEPFAPLFGLSRDPLFAPGGVRPFLPPADVAVSDDDVTVVLDVPGFAAHELDIELTGDLLAIRGERSLPFDRDDDRVWQRLERGFGSFERLLTVPKGLDPDHIEATIADGVLTLRIPKPEALKPRRIEIAGSRAPTGIETPAFDSSASEERELAGAAA